jgi:3-hydroxybutyryl-CoA dehydrogenase
VVEAIVEKLEDKRALLQQLERVLKPQAVLASNTSSINITAMARGMEHPGRLVGMHFFNPVPLMRLVEVVSGLHTDPAVAAEVFAIAERWGKVAVHARSTPGFIVNRIARPFYAEALALLQEQAATPLVIDACLRGAGFRMGPCELMDLIGQDTNFAVTSSVYEANFFDKRFVPSLVQRELVDGGLFGRKSGRGFYSYPEGPPPLPALAAGATPKANWIVVHGSGTVADALYERTRSMAEANFQLAREPHSDWTGLQIDRAVLVVTDGTPAYELAARMKAADVAVIDRFPSAGAGAELPALAYAIHAQATVAWRNQVRAWVQALGFRPLEVADVPGLIVARTIAMLVNEAADAALQGVCSARDADAAMKLGVNYPAGPFEWLAQWSRQGVCDMIEALDRCYRGERYRVSPWLRRPMDT